MQNSPAFVSMKVSASDASTELDVIGKGSKSIIVVDAEFSHVPELPKNHDRYSMFQSDKDRIVRMPREVACVKLEKIEDEWHITGKFMFTCVLPPKKYCAMIPCKTASVMLDTEIAMEELETEHMDVLRKNLEDRTVGDILFDPAPHVVYNVFDTIRDALGRVQKGSYIANRILQKMDTIERTKQVNYGDMDWIRSQLEKVMFNIHDSHCVDSARSAREKCIDLYANDAYYKLMLDDAQHSNMRLLVEAMNQSTVVCKTQYFLGAIRNHCAKYKLPQPHSGIDIFDVSIYDPISRSLFGSAKLKTSSQSLPMPNFIAECFEEGGRKKDTLFSKCFMVLQIAIHLASLFNM